MGKITWKRWSHSHICIPCYHKSLNELSSQNKLHISWSTYHISASSHRASCWSASWCRWDPPMHEPGCDEHTTARGKHKPASWFRRWFFASASRVNCGHACEAASFGLAETLCCRSHKRNGSSPLGSLAIEQWLQPLDLQRNTKKI